MLIQCNSPFLFYCNIPNHKEIKENYYPLILNSFREIDVNPPLDWNCNVKTTVNYELSFLREDHLLDSIVWNPMDQMLKEVKLNYYPKNSDVSTIWANLYQEMFFQEVHNHVGPHNLSHFAGIYIIDQRGKNQISFTNYDNHFGYLNTRINTKEIEDIGEGTVMIFPSHFLHYVNPVDKPRCTISFNINSNF